MFSIERSGYSAWLKRKPGACTISNKELDEKIRTIFKKHQSRYGAQRITDELRDWLNMQ